MTPLPFVLAAVVVWLAAFRLARGSWRLRSVGTLDALDRNVSLIIANVAVVGLNVGTLVVVRVVGAA